MPNIQFSIPEGTYVEIARRAQHLGISANRLGKAILVEWVKQDGTMTLEAQAALLRALEPPPLPEGFILPKGG